MIRRPRRGSYEPGHEPPRWLKPLNTAFLLVRRFGGMSTLHVLTVPGRVTGRPRSTAVTVVTVEDERYLLEGFLGADWSANVRAARGTHDCPLATAPSVELIELDPTDAIVVLRQWSHHAATGARIIRDASIVDDITPDAFADLAGKCGVFGVLAVASPKGGKEADTTR